MSRIVLRNIPLKFDPDGLAALCGIKKDSSLYMELRESITTAEQTAKPRAVIKWCDVSKVSEITTTVDGVHFESKVMSNKLKDCEKVFVYVMTAGDEIEKCADIKSRLIRETLATTTLVLASKYVFNYIQETFSLASVGSINPGSLPDWPIENNSALFDIIGNVSETIGVSLTSSGYMTPFNSVSGIIFSDTKNYINCILCQRSDCIGRHAPFDDVEYKRIFGTPAEEGIKVET